MIRSMSFNDGRVSFSGVPNNAIYTELAAASLDCWWNLAEELGALLPRMQQVAKEVLWARVPDYRAPVDVPLFLGQLDRVCTILRGGGRVHASCLGGRGRTGMALAAVRVRVCAESADVALATARILTGGGPEVEEQRAFVRALTVTRSSP